ncbi:low molecular weight phosphatase family protein [Sinomonas cyclohexanicum]|uniref:Low molecular weight phosphatase family protein n=1 Tax=Sinomonas cyclohexanicum TaxID=322009 RepID=A0ABM7PXL6_SINCY|nr:hypothetical protein [Corynebacterium cyclohexanicum]BCT77041.1 low molecular weight phosphatase family protein [Corynebacterium cyclohexanicum]
MHTVPFHILLVCSGNLCRSPWAEQFLRMRVAAPGVAFSSAGLVAAYGHAMPEEASLLSRRYGGLPDGHRSRPLSAELLRSADVVLTASREQRGAVAHLLPRMSARTFTISEFSRLLGALRPPTGPDRPIPWDGLVESLRAVRGLVPPPGDPEADDIEDPYRRPLAVYERVAARLDRETAVIADFLENGIAAPSP